jgi:hypothetical protein
MLAQLAHDDEDVRPGLFFEALRPAATLAVEAGVPLDSARDLLIRALLDVARQRWPSLAVRALALGRTTRSVRGLEKRPDPVTTPRGVNVVQRAEDELSRPRTRGQLAVALPTCDGFDSGRVALAALLRTGRAVAVPGRRGEPTRYQRTQAAPQAPADAAERIEIAQDHLRTVGDAMSVGRVRTEQVRATPEALAAAQADIEAFIERRITEMAARASGDDVVEGRVYFGSAATTANTP